MPLYLTVSTGPRADKARPIMAISDPHLIATLLRAIGQLAGPAPSPPLANLEVGRETERRTRGKEGER
jgi:hypothetical protein